MAHSMRTSGRLCEIVLGFAIEPEPWSLGSPRVDSAEPRRILVKSIEVAQSRAGGPGGSAGEHCVG